MAKASLEKHGVQLAQALVCVCVCAVSCFPDLGMILRMISLNFPVSHQFLVGKDKHIWKETL